VIVVPCVSPSTAAAFVVKKALALYMTAIKKHITTKYCSAFDTLLHISAILRIRTYWYIANRYLNNCLARAGKNLVFNIFLGF